MISNKEEKKEKSIAFISNDDNMDSLEEYDERLSEEIVLFGKQFNKVLELDEWRPRSNGQNSRYNISEKQDDTNKTGTDDMVTSGQNVLPFSRNKRTTCLVPRSMKIFQEEMLRACLPSK
jgi:hypothetical protein